MRFLTAVMAGMLGISVGLSTFASRRLYVYIIIYAMEVLRGDPVDAWRREVPWRLLTCDGGTCIWAPRAALPWICQAAPGVCAIMFFS